MKLQSRLIVAVVLSVLPIFVGCGEKTSSSGIPVQSEGNKPLSRLAYQAIEQALETWKPTKLGDSYYVYVTASRQGSSWDMICEFRRVKVIVSQSDLSEVNRLNGQEWVGAVFLSAELFRIYGETDLLGNSIRGWSHWQGDMGSHNIRELFSMGYAQTNGKWEESAPRKRLGNPTYSFKHVEQSDIPK